MFLLYLIYAKKPSSYWAFLNRLTLSDLSIGNVKADRGGPQRQAARRAVRPVRDGKCGVSEARWGVRGASDGIETMISEIVSLQM